MLSPAPSVPVPGGVAPRRPGRRAWLVVAAAVLVVAVALVFGQVRSFGFVDYDDDEYVFRNPHLLQGSALDRVRWACTALYAANWHPLTWLTFVADGALFGLEPGRLHAENLLLHAVNVVLLLAALVRMTGSPGKSLLVAALFAVHPLRAESVAWITERKGLLMALLALGAVHAHLSYARRPTPGRYGAMAALCAGALLAKPQAVALPALLVILDWWPLNRIGPRATRAAVVRALCEKVPLLLAAAGATALTIAAQRQAHAIAPLAALPAGARLASAAAAPLLYVGKTLWPSGLSPAYPLVWHPAWVGAVAAFTLAALTAAALRWRDGRPWMTAGWLGFLVLLAPVSNLFQAGGQALADRYTYLAHVPLLVLVVWAGGEIAARRPRLRWLAAVAAVAGAAALGVVAHRQAAYWRDDVALFSRAVAVTTGNWKMHYNLGKALALAGRPEEAERQLHAAIEVRPDYPEALNNLGALAGERGDAALAESLFVRALQVDSGYGQAWFNLGLQREQRGDVAGALQAYGRAAALQPGLPEPLVRMGWALLRRGLPEQARAACERALRLAPDDEDARECLRELAAGR